MFNNKIFYHFQIIKRSCSSLPLLNEAVLKAEKVSGFSSTSKIKDILLNSNEQQRLLNWVCEQNHHKHPISSIIRKLDSKIGVNNYKSGALLALLLAKVAGVPNSNWLSGQNHALKHERNIFEKQLLLAETIEILYWGCQFHSFGILPIENVRDLESNELKMILEGNKLAFTNGCYLIYKLASQNYIKLSDHRVAQIMSKAVMDFIHGEISEIKVKDELMNNNTDDLLEKWMQTSYLKSASLIAAGCHAMLLLAEHNELTQEVSIKFGTNVALAWHVYDELEQLKQLKDISIDEPNFLLPNLLHLKQQNNCKVNLSSFKNFDRFLKDEAIEKTKALVEFYLNNAVLLLNYFQESETRNVLENMLKAIKFN